MAWRPTEYLIEGELDNTEPGKVTGWMQFAGMKEKMTLCLTGDFHRDIRGAKIHLKGDAQGPQDDPKASKYLEHFAPQQTGKVGDITAGLPPYDYTSGSCYIEWYSEENGRVVIELEPHQVEVIGTPIPACESDPVSRAQQSQNMAEFLGGIAAAAGLPETHTVCVTGHSMVAPEKEPTGVPRRGMKLLTKEIRRRLPPLYSQDGKGGKAVAHAKFFAPDTGAWTWYCTEGSPVTDDEGREIDFQFFGLVEGLDKELGYFSLAELEGARGPMGLPIERDLHWHPRTLEEIAPELFAQATDAGES
jgi:hypothetical protein